MSTSKIKVLSAIVFSVTLVFITNVELFANFYIVNELMKNPDIGFSSVFMTMRGQGSYRRLYKGPIWDFDMYPCA